MYIHIHVSVICMPNTICKTCQEFVGSSDGTMRKFERWKEKYVISYIHKN